MAQLKETIYNVSAIHKRLGKSAPKREDLYLFARGIYRMLTPEQLQNMQLVIDADYKEAKRILSAAKQELKQLTKSKS